MSKLDELRKEIDRLDDEIVTLLEQRASTVLKVREAKKKDNINVYAPSRERQILDRITRLGGSIDARPISPIMMIPFEARTGRPV